MHRSRPESRVLLIRHSQTPTTYTAPERNLGPHCSSVATQPWYPILLSLLIDLLVLLPHSLDTILPSPNCDNPQQQSPPQLAVWRVSSNNLLHREFCQTLILSSWRQKTNSNYNSAWRKWEQWCHERAVNPFSASLPDILSFLTKQFQDGKQYRSLNCYRSAISSTHLLIEGFPIRKHPLITCLLKGAFNERPPLPKYASTWEVSTVLTNLSQLGQNKNLTLSVLTKKLTMLLALVLGHRSSDLKRLLLEGRKYTANGVYLMPMGLGKQCRPDHSRACSPYLLQHLQRIHPCTPSYAYNNMRRPQRVEA